jgi:hypothetical protein
MSVCMAVGWSFSRTCVGEGRSGCTDSTSTRMMLDPSDSWYMFDEVHGDVLLGLAMVAIGHWDAH